MTLGIYLICAVLTALLFAYLLPRTSDDFRGDDGLTVGLFAALAGATWLFALPVLALTAFARWTRPR